MTVEQGGIPPATNRGNFAAVSRSDGTMAKLNTKSGRTRGKNPRDITYEAFDLEQPDSLPKSMDEFMEVTGVKKQSELVDLLINGFNDAQYSAASDEIGEFINDAWDKETQAQFRLAVRNTNKLQGPGTSIEDTVNLLKPGVEKGWLAKVAAKKAAEEAVKEAPKA